MRAFLHAITISTLACALACASDDDNAGQTQGSTTTSAGQGGNLGTGNGGTTSSGGQGEGGEDPFACGETISQAKLEQLPADIIVAVDNSLSMAFEASQVKTNMNALVGALTATGIDAHVVVISKESSGFFFDPTDTGVCLPTPVGSGSCPADEKLPGYRHIVQEIGNNDALQKIVDTYPEWQASLRPNATKTFLVVSDDESGMTPQEFTQALAQLSPPIVDFKFNAVVASQDPLSCAICAITGCSACTNPCCDKNLACIPMSQNVGQSYMDLQTQTMGIYGDLCEQAFAPVFGDMANAVIEHTPVSCGFELPTPPNGVIVPSETNVDFMPTSNSTPQPIYNVASESDCTVNGGWYFDNPSTPKRIDLCPTTCATVQQSTEGSVRVKYGCKTLTTPR